MTSTRPVSPFSYKTYGRIFTRSKADTAEVRRILRAIDSDEFETYMPFGLVTELSDDNKLLYTHKFEMCKYAIARECLKAGIPVWIVDNQRSEEMPA